MKINTKMTLANLFLFIFLITMKKGAKMTNISVYVVVNLTINDADEYRIYVKRFFPNF